VLKRWTYPNRPGPAPIKATSMLAVDFFYIDCAVTPSNISTPG
jgi:hypothetical protein